jgi:hypothetical protein
MVVRIDTVVFRDETTCSLVTVTEVPEESITIS